MSGHVFVYYGSSDKSSICILWFKWSVMYLYTTVQVSDHLFVCYDSSDQSCIVYYGSSDQSCICILWFKWSVMHLYTTVQVSGHVFVYYGSSDQSCICILWFKWSVMYLSLSTMFLLELNHFRQCCIFLLDFEPFPTVWYFSIRFWTMSDSVVYLVFFFILSAIMFILYVR